MIELFKKYKEVLMYLIFGGLTTLVNIVSYLVLTKLFGIEYMISNVIAWFLSVVFAYITNKIFVFESKTLKIKAVLKEVCSFFGARLFSLGIDMVIMYIAIDMLGINDFISKISANVVVVIVNYFLSKYWIFKKDK